VPATIFSLVTAFIAQLLVIVYPGVFLFWFVFHSNIERWRTMGNRAFLWACLGWPFLSSTILLFSDRIFAVRWDPPGWMIAIGLGVAVLAFVTGAGAAKIIPKRTLLGIAELEARRKPQPILQTGIYGRTRNPVYFTHWLIILSAALLSGYAASWIFLAIDSILLPLLMRVEEKELLARYGKDYQDYMARVPRFFPRF
jgi:protein-S-isoprenylcysteine O-methyltransferase Ste14